MYRAFLPGLGLWRGSEAYLSSNLAAQVLPPPARASFSTAISAAAVTRRAPPGWRRWARSCSRRSAGSSFRSWRWCCCRRRGGRRLSAARGALSLVVTAVVGVAGYCLLRRAIRSLAGSESAAAALVDPCEARADPLDDGAGEAAELRARRSPSSAGLGAGIDRGRRQPLPDVPDPARGAPVRRRVVLRVLRRLTPSRLSRSRSGPGRSSRSRAAASGSWTASSSPCSSSSAAPPTTRSSLPRSSGASSTPS